jgi:hypothetical protein
MDEGGLRGARRSISESSTDQGNNIEEEIFDAQIPTMCFASWLSSLPRDQVRRGRPFPPRDGRIF